LYESIFFFFRNLHFTFGHNLGEKNYNCKIISNNMCLSVADHMVNQETVLLPKFVCWNKRRWHDKIGKIKSILVDYTKIKILYFSENSRKIRLQGRFHSRYIIIFYYLPVKYLWYLTLMRPQVRPWKDSEKKHVSNGHGYKMTFSWYEDLGKNYFRAVLSVRNMFSAESFHP